MDRWTTVGFWERLADFAGLPVVAYPDTKDGMIPAAALAKPGDYAWRFHDTQIVDSGAASVEDQFAAFLDRVDTSAVRAIVIGNWDDSYSSGPLGIVAAMAAAADRLSGLRAVFLGDIIGEECELSWIYQTDVSPLLTAYPHLEEFWTRGSLELAVGRLSHDGLKKIVVQSGGLPAEFVRSLDACTLPQLEHLEIYLGTDEYGGNATPSDLTEILSGAAFPRLTYLGLRNAIAANEMAEAVANAPVVAQLKTLDLSLGALTDNGADALLNGQPLTHLELLDLHHHYLSDAMMERVEEAFLGTKTEVDLSEPEEPEELDDNGEPEWLDVAYTE